MARALETFYGLWRTVTASSARVTSTLTTALVMSLHKSTAPKARTAGDTSPVSPVSPVAPSSPAHRAWQRGVNVVFVLLLIAVVVNGLVALSSFRLLVMRERLISQSRGTEVRIATLESQLLDAENSQRGYLLTGDPRYLSSYTAARAAIETEVEQLQALIATDDAQQQRVITLKPIINTKLAELQQGIDLRARQQTDAAIAVLGSAASTQTTAALRARLSELAAAEQQQSGNWLRLADRRLTETQITTLVATLADILLVLAFFIFVRRSLAAREQHLRHEQQARATAERAVELRDQFLSIASHELRTPVTALLTTVALLERRFQSDHVQDDLQQQGFAVLERQLARLEGLIATMLDISRIDRGQLQLASETVDLVAVVRTLIEEVQPTTESHTIEVVAAEPALLVRGDRLRLVQVVLNLLQNAIKYSPQGGPLTVALERDGEWASLSVTDRGMGISQEALPRVFDRFYRAPSVRSEHISGLGIGLYVTREIVALHHGEITASSTEGAGSTFTVRLPLLTSEVDGQGANGHDAARPISCE